MRLSRLWIAATGMALLAWPGNSRAADFTLPEGSAPEALSAPYFPNRMYEFIWRNWSLVAPEEIAAILETSPEKVTAIAESMGLPPAATVPPLMKTRGYITLIRRNWHLLPYDQLLQLLDWTPERLAIALREDDFLWIKLGNLKPKCKPLHYSEPDASAQARAAEIKQLVQEEIGDALRQSGEPRFAFVEQLRVPASDYRPIETIGDEADQSLSLRFIYSYCAVYGDPLSNPELDPYPEGLLQRLAGLGINGVWLHVVLRDMAPGGPTFPEFGVGCEERLANLQKLVERAKKYGIRIYLYMNEPRAMPDAFFEAHGRAEMAGVREDGFAALCTSHPEVRRWMHDALAHVFRTVPDLGGVFSISAAENLTNCASHGGWTACPQCKDRSFEEILADVNGMIEQGVHDGNRDAKVIAWDWNWHGWGNAMAIVEKLPKSVWLMSVSEWGLPINRGGINQIINEYALSGVGPSDRALREWELAKKCGLKTVAKVQLNNTWELSSLPYLPVMDLVARHCQNLASANVDGMMLSWTLGGYPSPNLEIAARFTKKPTPAIDSVLDAIAVEQFGSQGAPSARKAWTAFSTAFQEYPFDVWLVYHCPAQMGPANPLYRERTSYRATMVGIPYDDLNQWRVSYPPEVFIGQFSKVAEGWRSGIPHLKEAVDAAPPDRRDEAQAELRYAEAAAIHFQSVANQAGFILARDALADSSNPLSVEQRSQHSETIRRCVQSEIDLARRLFVLTQEDSKIGFEPSNHYYYVPLDLVEKVINGRWLLDHEPR